MSVELALWQAFAARVTLTFPFRVDVTVVQDGDRVQMGVELHVLDRETREPITVHTRRYVAGPVIGWTNDEDAIAIIFELLEIALRHEMNESVRLGGELVRDTHKALA